MKKKIGIGISDFRELIESNCLFVDKSDLITEVIDSGAKVLLIPRPRRFGKTLNLSMLRCFFERHDSAEGKKQVEALFNGLAIRKSAVFQKHFARYPVIFLTFKDVKKTTFEGAMYKIRLLLAEETSRHLQAIRQEGAEGNWLSALLTRIEKGEGDREDYEETLRKLSEVVHEIYGSPPVILIDEYDTPIHAAWQHGYYDEMISFMRGLLSGGLKDNPHVYKGIITGILRVAKESIFSDLNNLAVYTILARPFSAWFGLTRDEVDSVLEEYGMQDRLEDVDAWYNGYRFGDHIIFNPWSIMNFIAENPQYPEPYWANTSSNELVKELVISGGMDVREKMEQLISGRPIESVIDQNIVFPDLHKKERYIYSLFFFSGYLKCVEQRQVEEQVECTLAIPNREVRYIFRNIISNWLEESFGNAKLTTMLKALVAGNIDQFSRLLNEFVITTLSFFDTKGKNPEAVYQAFVLGMLLHLGQEYEISSNRELGYGRYDILAMPRKEVKDRPAILMEMKSITGFYEQEPEKAMEEAVSQINHRGYARELEAKGFGNVLKIAVVSDGKKVWVKELDNGLACDK